MVSLSAVTQTYRTHVSVFASTRLDINFFFPRMGKGGKCSRDNGVVLPVYGVNLKRTNRRRTILRSICTVSYLATGN